MCVICRGEIEIDPVTQSLDCDNCQTLTNIPIIPGLRELKCSE